MGAKLGVVLFMNRVFLKNFLLSRASKLDKNHMNGKNVYTYHIYILGHLRMLLVITRFICLLLLQERFKLTLIFLNKAFSAIEDFAYSLVNSGITTFC